MDTIQQLTNNKKIAIVWYGECGEDCVDYDLNDSANATETNKIDHIYEIADDQTKSIFYSSYVGHIHNGGVQTLTTLQCGHAYYVVLKEGNDTLNIPNMTLAHAGISAGKISQSCAIAPEIEFVDLIANIPADLKLKITVNIDDLIAPCAANTWKYKIIKGGENETDEYTEIIVDDVEGGNTTPVGVNVEEISSAMPEGGIYYKVVIWGENANGDKITEEPDQEKVVLMPWPSGLFSIVGTVGVNYLEYEGPSPSSTELTFSGQDSLIESLHLIKPSLKETSGADTNVVNWQYQINGTGAWTEYNDILSDDQVEVQYTDKIYWRLKEDLSAGAEVDLSKNYNATMVVKYVEKNGTTLFVETDLIGDVLNRKITIRAFKDDRNFNASLDITRLNVKRWDYKLEKLNDNQTDVETTVRDFSSIIATGAERGTETEDSTINIQSIIESEGAGYYRVTVQGYHKTDNGIVVTDVPAVDETFFNWVAPTFAISSTGANTGTVDVFYREYEGPSSSEPLVLTAQTNVHSVEFTSKTNQTNWFYGLDATADVSPLPVNPANIDVTNKNNINFILKEDLKASGTVDVAYDSDLEFVIKGKDTVHPVAIGTTLNPELTIKGHVKERITSIDTLVIQSNDPNANTINLRATFDLTETNRYTFTWNKDSASLSTTDADTGATYNSNNLTKDLSVDLNTDNRGVYKFELVGKHSDANNNVVNESGWIAGQVAESDEKSITVNYPDPTFAVTSTISDGYKEREESSRATSPKVKVTTFHWMDHSEDITFTGPSDSIWEYKKSAGTWISVSATPVVVTKSEEIEVRVKEGKLVSDNGTEILNWSATSLDGTTKTDTTTLNANITEGEELPKVAWIGFQDGNTSTYSNWYKLDVIDNEFIDLTEAVADWNSKTTIAGFMSQMTGVSGNCTGKSFDFALKENVQLDSCKHRGDAGAFGMQDPIGEAINPSLASAADSDSAWNSLNGKSITEVDGKLGVSLPTSYTKMKISESETSYSTELSTLASSSGGDDVAYFQGAMITASPERPVGMLTQEQLDNTFNSDGINVFCNGCPPESSESGVNLRIDQDEDGSSNVKRYNATSCNHAGMTSGNWNGANLYFRSTAAASNGSLRRLGDESKPININEIYFDLASDDSKIKLVNGKLPDCA